jgi:hypothetical protein
MRVFEFNSRIKEEIFNFIGQISSGNFNEDFERFLKIPQFDNIIRSNYKLINCDFYYLLNTFEKKAYEKVCK